MFFFCHVCNLTVGLFKLCWFVSSQFQLVADLFQEKDDAVASKSSKINVRSAKSTPKAPNKDHRKTVGHQVGLPLLSARRSGGSRSALTSLPFSPPVFSSATLSTY